MANTKGKGRNVRRSSGRRKNRPKIRFSIWGLILLFAFAFAVCFVLYMVKANLDEDFLEEEFGSSIVAETVTEPAAEEDTTEAEGEAEEETTAPKAEITNPVPQSEAAEAGYFDNSCLITDSTLLHIAEFTNFTDVIGSEALNALNCNSTKVETNYGTVTVYETMQIKKPENVYIMLGSNIGTDPTDEMIENYSKLIDNIHSARPDMNIYVMQYPPVKAEGEDNSKNELINDYNSKLLAMADKYQVHCIDTNTALKNQDGTIAPEFLDEEGKLNETAYSTITGYILTHIAQ
ncbi:MAG: hypothetical protein K6B38_02030 [Ruminococcus sp.]|nr:hypothetical protein [Ruminococcus sp.]